jgi:hypothetical protein
MPILWVLVVFLIIIGSEVGCWNVGIKVTALKVRNTLAMGASHRNCRKCLKKALKGRNISKDKKENDPALSGLKGIIG